ncbi:MAG: hypothetical protein WBC06_03220 [Chitinophagaceae bacterium]
MCSYKYITTFEKWEIENITNEIFCTDSFSKDKAVFPENIFNKQFLNFGFVHYNDCFRNHEDFNGLIDLLKLENIKSIIISCPEFYHIIPVEVKASIDFKSFCEIISFTNVPCYDEFYKGVGYFISPEIFMYEKEKGWAMLHDITNNVIVIGYDNISMKKYFPALKENYIDLFKNKEGVINGLTAEAVHFIEYRMNKYYN